MRLQQIFAYKLFMVLGILLFTNSMLRADSTWVSIDTVSTGSNFEFSMPSQPDVYDTLTLNMFALKVDSLLSLQVFEYDSTDYSRVDGLFETALEESQGDTLEAFSKKILLTSDSELLSIKSVSHNGGQIQGIEMGIDYQSVPSPDYMYSFMQIFKYDEKIVLFIITGFEADADRLMDFKDDFFDSIVFY
ncbi:MAG: hypothetical protein WD048_16270 [Chitinophagales bacterium]